MPFGTEKKIDRVKMWLQTDKQTGQLFGDYCFRCPKENTIDTYWLYPTINTSFVSLEGPEAQAIKTGINIMNFIFLFAENSLK